MVLPLEIDEAHLLIKDKELIAAGEASLTLTQYFSNARGQGGERFSHNIK